MTAGALLIAMEELEELIACDESEGFEPDEELPQPDKTASVKTDTNINNVFFMMISAKI